MGKSVTPTKSRIESLEEGDDISVKCAHQWYRGKVTAVETDPDSLGRITLARRLVCEAEPPFGPYTFHVELVTGGRVRAMKPGNPGANVMEMEL